MSSKVILIRSTRLAGNRLVNQHSKPIQLRTLSTNRSRLRDALDNRQSTLPFIPTCPAPQCECAEMPPDLNIDTRPDLYGTMAAYSDHVLISTGQSDWKSKIEDERTTASWGELIGNMKDLLGPQGKLHDPYRNVVVSASSFKVAARPETGASLQALHFPSFTMIDGIDPKLDSTQTFLQRIVLGETSGDEIHASNLQFRPIDTPTILICSHNSRDSRCGILGPLLQNEFMQYINKRNTLRSVLLSKEVQDGNEDSEGIRSISVHPKFEPKLLTRNRSQTHPINVGMISHIGGHKWAGNVIVYIPPNYQTLPLTSDVDGPSIDNQNQPTSDTVTYKPGTTESWSDDKQQPKPNLLAGKGIWYGRVEPRHVQGIVEETIGRGKIIRELFRGGIDVNGQPLRL